MGTQPYASQVARLASPLIAAILLVAAAILFIGVYLIFPQNAHAFALLLIGILGVALAVVAYLLESVSRQPTIQRGVAWGFYAFGFAVIFLTLGLNPSGYLNLTDQVIALVVTLVVLAGSIAAIAWRYRTVAEVAPREAERAAWRNTAPTSAFDYTTAHAPSAPTTAPAGPSPRPSRHPKEVTRWLQRRRPPLR